MDHSAPAARHQPVNYRDHPVIERGQLPLYSSVVRRPNGGVAAFVGEEGVAAGGLDAVAEDFGDKDDVGA